MFGFGRDRDEVNGFDYIDSDGSGFTGLHSYIGGLSHVSTDEPPVLHLPRQSADTGLPIHPPAPSGFRRDSRTRAKPSSRNRDGGAGVNGVFYNTLGCREIPEHSKIWVVAHKWRPSQDRPCWICREPGHDASNCLQGLMNRAAVAQVECVRGRHFPYLHGVWRCQNCGNHLYDKDVKEQYPEFHARETAKEWEKMKKYGAPCLSWQ